MSRPPTPRRRGWRLLLLPLLSLLALELAGQVLARLKPEWLRPPAHWADADALAGEPWAEAYFDEWWRSYRVAWEPYTYWRRQPFHGEYIEVGADGIRRTVPGPASPDAPTVCVFGGSTLWGFGARDAHTIPSCLARILADEHGLDADVVNLGETGYVSTQGLLALLRRLQAGEVPDLVVFYDGINDVFSAYQAGAAGLPQNEYRRRQEFNLLGDNSGRTAFLVGAAGYRLLRQSAVVRWTESLARAVAPPALPGSFAPALPEAEAARLAGETASVYLANVRILEALADRYGFGLLCAWQPTLFDKPVRSPYEARQAEAFAYLDALYRQTTAAVGAGAGHPAGPGALLVLTDVFRDTPDPRFLDFCHVSEAGNADVARALAGPVADRLRRLQPPPP